MSTCGHDFYMHPSSDTDVNVFLLYIENEAKDHWSLAWRIDRCVLKSSDRKIKLGVYFFLFLPPDLGWTYLWNYLTLRNGSPIKICRTSQGKQLGYFQKNLFRLWLSNVLGNKNFGNFSRSGLRVGACMYAKWMIDKEERFNFLFLFFFFRPTDSNFHKIGKKSGFHDFFLF